MKSTLLRKSKLQQTRIKMQFIDLKSQGARVRNKIDARFKKILDDASFVMGSTIDELEADLSKFCGAKNSISCSSGTDALSLALMAWGVGKGDAVFVPSFTFTASAEVIFLCGATPAFVDVDKDTFNISAKSFKSAIETVKEKGLTSKVVIGVDLFGQSADWDAIIPIARENDIKILDDAAQGFGGEYKGKKLGVIGDACATSFFPAKPLGCYGDGGAVFTNDDELNHIMRSIRIHGQSASEKYKNSRIGLNARLDTMQAAVLIEKLKIFDSEIVARNKVAKYYSEALKDCVQTPYILDNLLSVWAQYSIVLPMGTDRQVLQAKMSDDGIPTAVYYPIAMHDQVPYKTGIIPSGGLEVSQKLCKTILSLPMHPYLSVEDQDKVINSLCRNLK